MTKEMKPLYVIRDKDTGLFSSGRLVPKWVDIQRCKKWSGTGPLRNHLRMFTHCEYKDGEWIAVSKIPPSWEVLQVVMYPGFESVTNASEFLEKK